MDYLISTAIIIIYILLMLFNQIEVILSSLMMIVVVIYTKNKLEGRMEDKTLGQIGNEIRLIKDSLKAIDYCIAIPFIAGLIISTCTEYLLIGSISMLMGVIVCFLRDAYRKFKQKIGGKSR